LTLIGRRVEPRQSTGRLATGPEVDLASVAFNSRCLKEGKGAINWTRLSCRSLAANAVRLRLHSLAYNLGNFPRALATPEPIEEWSLTTLKEKLIKIGAKVVSHGRYVVFQMAEVATPRDLFADILRMIAELRRAASTIARSCSGSTFSPARRALRASIRCDSVSCAASCARSGVTGCRLSARFFSIHGAVWIS
jgi:hypothetical protein